MRMPVDRAKLSRRGIDEATTRSGLVLVLFRQRTPLSGLSFGEDGELPTSRPLSLVPTIAR